MPTPQAGPGNRASADCSHSQGRGWGHRAYVRACAESATTALPIAPDNRPQRVIDDCGGGLDCRQDH
jgi:hypothetical protein